MVCVRQRRRRGLAVGTRATCSLRVAVHAFMLGHTCSHLSSVGEYTKMTNSHTADPPSDGGASQCIVAERALTALKRTALGADAYAAFDLHGIRMSG